MKTPNRINIEQLHLRVPGLSKHQGKQLGEQIAQGLATQWPAGRRPLDLGAMDIAIKASYSGGDTQYLANQVVKAIVGRCAHL